MTNEKTAREIVDAAFSADEIIDGLCWKVANRIKDALDAKDAVIAELVEALEFLVNGEPKNGEENKACTFCDMGGAGYSALGDGNHDDIRDVCPVLKAEQALATYRKEPRP